MPTFIGTNASDIITPTYRSGGGPRPGNGPDTIYGYGGADTLGGGLGNDWLDGGAGTDTASYADAIGNVAVSLVTNRSSGALGVDTLVSIENVTGGAGHDTITGNSGANVLRGGGGNDLVQSGGGTDTVYGDAGNDDLRTSGSGQYYGGVGNDHIWSGGLGLETLSGGTGDGDLLVAAAWTGNYTINLATQTTTVPGKTISGFENVIAGAGHNTIIGSGGNNTIMGGKGNDWIDGGGGTDTADYFWATGRVQVNLQTGRSSGADGYDTLTSIENVFGSNHADTITGNSGANYLNGAGGSDVLFGGGGADTIDGGGGADRLSGGAGADVFNFAWAAQSKEGGRHDLITDWVFDEDKIDLRQIDANELVDGNQAFSTVKGNGTGQLSFSTLPNGNTLIRGNTDGDPTTFELEIEVVDGAWSHTYWSTTLDFFL